MNTYEQKRQRRIERLERCARLYSEQSTKLHESARSMAEMIPFGQPILVGHHSERGDRAYRSRIQRRFEKSFELQEKSEYYARRAASAISNRNISSDDPEAVFKLEEKKARLEKLQETMKAVNKIIRKYDLNDEAQKKICVEEIIKAGLLKDENALKIVEPSCFNAHGFERFELTNNNANIRAIEKRIEALKAGQQRTTTEIMFGDIRVVQNVEENRLQIFFPDKPSEEKRAELKRNGFRWSPYNGCWQAFLNNRAIYFVKEAFKQ